MKKNRGALTPEVQELATALLGREINVRELRLMPYFIHLGMNGSIIARERLFEGDREVIDTWNKEGRVACKVGDIPKISPEFWIIMAKIVHKSYVLNLEGE